MTQADSQRAFGNAAILTAGAAAETVLQFAFLLIAGRELGPEEFGFYGYLLSLVTLASAVANFGLPVIAVREISQRPAAESEIMAATFRIRGWISIGFFLAAGIPALFLMHDGTHQVAVWLVFAYLFFVPFDLAPFFDARKLSRWDVPGKITGRILSLGLLIVFWRMDGILTVAETAVCSSLLMAVNVVIAWMIARRQAIALPIWSVTREVRLLVRHGAMVMWSNVMALAYTQSLIVLVKWFSTALETGFYALTGRLLLPVLVFKGVIYRVLLPLVSEAAHDREQLTARLEKVLPALALIFMPAVAIAIPAVDMFLVPLFGVEYVGAVRPLQISLSHILFTGFGSLIGSTVLASGDARTPTIGLTIGCIISLAASALLIPSYGAVGAAWAAWIGEVSSTLYPLPKFLRIVRPRVGGRLLRLALSSAVSCALFFAAKTICAPILSLTLSIFALLLLLIVSKEITRDRILALTDLLRGSARS